MKIPAPSHSTWMSFVLLLTACAGLPDSGRRIADGQAFAMQPGDQVAFPDLGALRYVGVDSDSRCPPDVQCIHAGNAVVAFRWTPSGGAGQDFMLSTPEPPRARNLGQRRLTLLSLAQGGVPQATLRIERLP